MTRVVVVGAGITGLTLAHRLAVHGRDVVLLEESDRVGGAIHTLAKDGHVVERGPSSLLSTALTDGLCRELSLSPIEGAPGAPRHIVRHGRPIALRPGLGAAFAPILSWPAKVRVLGDLILPSPAALDDESIQQTFTRRFGPEVARYLAGPFISGVYAGDPARISTRSAFTKLWHAERTYRVGVIRGFTKMRKAQRAEGIAPFERKTASFADGLVALPDALAARLGPALRRGRKVVRLGAGAGAARFVVELDGGERVEAATVVLALPADRTAELLAPLAEAAARTLREIETVAVTTVSLSYPNTAFRELPQGFGTLIPRGEGFRILGCLYMSSLFPGRAPAGRSLVTCFIGGALDPDAIALDDAEMARICSEESSRLLGATTPPEPVAITRWPLAIPQYTLGHHTRVATVERALEPFPGLVALGNWRDGVALADRIAAAEAAAERLANGR